MTMVVVSTTKGHFLLMLPIHCGPVEEAVPIMVTQGPQVTEQLQSHVCARGI